MSLSILRVKLVSVVAVRFKFTPSMTSEIWFDERVKAMPLTVRLASDAA